ncbi:MAG: hypothetical protein WCX31_04535 [Salinivirgaceae bacterium]|jgi:hypothetical protein
MSNEKQDLTIVVKSEEKEEFKRAIIESIKIIAISSEGTITDNNSVIAVLCELFQKFDS